MNGIDGVKQSVVSAFLQRCASGLESAADLIKVYSNPTEEIADAAARRKAIKLYAGGQYLSGSGGAKSRLEENYLFDTRRFASGALTAGEYIFFASAIGLPATNNGFPAGVTVMSDVETNMDVQSQIPQGKDYVLTQIGVSFNSDIASADAGLLMESGAIRFEKQGGQFTLRHGPPKLWPGGTGLSGYSATTVAATTIAASHNGVADIRAVRKLAVPRVLRQKESFNYKYVVPRAVRNTDGSTAISFGASVLMTIWLWGGQQDSIPV
jgi:hypothetical protein